MIQITVQYEAQAGRAAGTSTETVEVSDTCCVADCIRQVADAHGEQLRTVLLTAAGEVQPSLLVFLNDVQIIRHADSLLNQSDILTLMTPISGG
ncbi:MAG: MoaD/ThiS family protein [Fuerstiella sp.]|nr:MoaD/ThiS family protein [Fuerstiella sp.]